MKTDEDEAFDAIKAVTGWRKRLILRTWLNDNEFIDRDASAADIQHHKNVCPLVQITATKAENAPQENRALELHRGAYCSECTQQGAGIQTTAFGRVQANPERYLG